MRRIPVEFGLPKRILINTEAAAWGEYDALSLDRLDNSFDVNVISLLQLVQTLFPNKEKDSRGHPHHDQQLTCGLNPPARFLGLAPSRVAQRVMAELLHENLARHGLAFSVFSINGAIDEPKMRAIYTDKPTSFFIQPDDIARAMVTLFDSENFKLAAELKKRVVVCLTPFDRGSQPP